MLLAMQRAVDNRCRYKQNESSRSSYLHLMRLDTFVFFKVMEVGITRV